MAVHWPSTVICLALAVALLALAWHGFHHWRYDSSETTPVNDTPGGGETGDWLWPSREGSHQ